MYKPIDNYTRQERLVEELERSLDAVRKMIEIERKQEGRTKYLLGQARRVLHEMESEHTQG